MTKSQALQYVRSQSDSDHKDETELEEAFAALFERAPDDEDREQGLWSHLCAEEQAELNAPIE